MLATNPSAQRGPYPAALQAILNLDCSREGQRWLADWDGLHAGPTPLYALPGLAMQLGVAALHLKDESLRSPLGSFKALGAPIALVRLLLRQPDYKRFDPAGLLQGRYAQALAEFTVISATDGNHGRALAAAARSAGCPCVIVLHAQVSIEREAAIAELGARMVRVAGNYDDSVVEAERLAQAHGFHVVSDTSYPGYEVIPRDVMQGYATIVAEVQQQNQVHLGDCPFTHVLLQGGVGGLAAGVVSGFWELCGERRPSFIVVEPAAADCLLQSALQGRAASASGTVDSVMAGLACGETSPLAWRFLQPVVDHFMTIEDADAVAAMRLLADPAAGDVPVVAGESGAAGVAGLRSLCADAAQARRCGLSAASRVLVINTEGATAPSIYEQLSGRSAKTVERQQQRWHAAQPV